ncbi:MAG: aminotransferase class I/II-fold pyridoxal phosphate-dependent enzyme [Clostridia bacterium]|nr:aminotransferase class I/II-fold pyridoxal phosphate-dependent enzyme [Clostridia bacterium]MBQ5439244.1 aminotransferase class I/II-fold pyridoxal phosphate-dependent enzyme [Clostridia bacterium]
MDYDRFLNSRIKNSKPSGIRKFFDIANEMDNVISLSIGEPDFKTPWHIRQKGIESLEKGKTWYTPNRGLSQLREEICKYFERRFDVTYSPETDVLVTVGGSEAIDGALRCIAEEGDEILIPQPSFVCYEPLTAMAGATPVIIETKAENEFRLTPQELEEKITDKTKMLILPFPNNPTGGSMSKEDYEAIAPIIEKHNLLVLSDEIYAELSYGMKPVSFASVKGMKERTIVISGFSKSYAMTGWRLGYALGPKEIIAQMTKLHQYAIMSAPTTAQYAAIEALRNGDSDIEEMREQYDMRRRLIVDSFNAMGLSCFEPKGAFYVFPCIKSTGLSSEDFASKLLLSKRVAVVPGNAFGDCGEGFVRVSYSYSLSHIKEALKRIKEFIKELENEKK